MPMEEGGGSSETEFVNIDTASYSLDSSAIFHVVTDIIAFILFMHQQIPSVLQDITQEFDELRAEFKELEVELAKNEVKAISTRRKQATRKREVKMGIRRFEKLMACVSNLKSALQLMFAEVPTVETISLVLGPSPLRPLHVYELSFPQGSVVSGDFSRSKTADNLSRKAIRTMISSGAGADSYAGPTKLFLLVKAPSHLNLPLHFLPKREFRQNRKRVPLRLRFRCRTRDPQMNAQLNDCANSDGLIDSASNDLIWFQCRHTIKGIAFRTSPPED
ncbi:hypothetical protein ABFS82_04G027400 [Erythranthe guttata]|uniref:uncharacterized protein LOC105957840 n=1 Tax=Erythranthe guttata TaxID=4155 RepID=UPI00064DCA51|nr:PREDICTED: uncharacterized protein LOC105957840 [Erythranthe guttata]|eukprot:XP_012837271.1 PREDICTED: uncharacterized protein LOC105957840 [Erythranthe guttata]